MLLITSMPTTLHSSGIQSTNVTCTVEVKALSVVRRGAPEAQTLYAETEQSIAKRENAAALRKAGAMGISTDGKPTKKQRRQLHQLHDVSDL